MMYNKLIILTVFLSCVQLGLLLPSSLLHDGPLQNEWKIEYYDKIGHKLSDVPGNLTESSLIKHTVRFYSGSSNEVLVMAIYNQVIPKGSYEIHVGVAAPVSGPTRISLVVTDFYFPDDITITGQTTYTDQFETIFHGRIFVNKELSADGGADLKIYAIW